MDEITWKRILTCVIIVLTVLRNSKGEGTNKAPNNQQDMTTTSATS